MKEFKRLSILVFVIMFIFSCTNSKYKPINQEVKVRYSINLPDTIYKGDTLRGFIKYSSDYSKIKLKNTERRYVFTSFGLKEKTTKDTFALIYDSIIPIYDIILEKRGERLLEGFIIDDLFLETNREDKKVKKSTVKTKINHTVYVK